MGCEQKVDLAMSQYTMPASTWDTWSARVKTNASLHPRHIKSLRMKVWEPSKDISVFIR